MKSSCISIKHLAELAICVSVAALPCVAWAQPGAARVTSVDLKVAVDRSSPCHLSMSVRVEASEKGTVWYRLLGPAGASFDFGDEGTHSLAFDTSFGIGRGVTMQHDISGEFRVQAAMVGTDGKHGPVTVSNPAPANYSCLGNSVATPTGNAVAAHQVKAAGKVSAVHLHLVPERYSGPCPGRVQLVGEFTTDGPGTVWYRFLAGAVSHSPEGTLVFDSAGTKTVAIDGAFNSPPRVPNAALIAAMEDSEGKHGPQTVTSGPVNYNISCVGR